MPQPSRNFSPSCIIQVRTYGHWQERLEELFRSEPSDYEIEFVNYKFGYFSAISFAIPFLRWLLVRRFRADLLRLCAARPRARIDLVGHSFGTHVIAWAVAGPPVDTKMFINTIILQAAYSAPRSHGTNISACALSASSMTAAQGRRAAAESIPSVLHRDGRTDRLQRRNGREVSEQIFGFRSQRVLCGRGRQTQQRLYAPPLGAAADVRASGAGIRSAAAADDARSVHREALHSCGADQAREGGPANFDKLPPSRAMGTNASTVLTVDSSGTLMEWAASSLERSPVSTLISPGHKWSVSRIVGNRILVFDEAGKTFSAWDIGNREKLWSKDVDRRRGIGLADDFSLSPDGKFVLINDRVFRVSDGDERAAPSAEDLRNVDDRIEHLKESALTATGSITLAGTFYNGFRDDLVFEEIPPPQNSGSEHKPAEEDTFKPERAEIDPKPHEVIHFLQNGRYYLYGSFGSVSIAELELARRTTRTSGHELIRFYFGGVSRLSEVLGRALLRQVVAIEVTGNEATLRLACGAVLRLLRSADNTAGELMAGNSGLPITRPKFDEVNERNVVALSPDARWLAVAGENFIRVWDAETGLPLTEKVAIGGTALDVAFDQDSTKVRIATTEGRLLELQTRFDWAEKPAWLEGLVEAVTAQALIDDGTFSRLTVASADAARNKFLGELRKVEPATSAAKLLRSYFDRAGR